MPITLPGLAVDSKQATSCNEHFEKLAPELKIAIIAEAVEADGVIDLKDFDKEVGKLLAPFEGDALAIAQEEVLKSNVFKLDLDDVQTVSLSDEYTRWYLPAPRFPENTTPSDESRDGEVSKAGKEHPRLFSHSGPVPPSRLPYRLSEKWIPIDAQKIRRLIVYSPSALCGISSYLKFPRVKSVLEAILQLFPKLERPGVYVNCWDLPVAEEEGKKVERAEKLGEVIEVVKKMELKKWMKHVNPTKKVWVQHLEGSKGELSLDFELKDKTAKGEEDKIYSVDELMNFSFFNIS